jgi:hypothetical protein
MATIRKLRGRWQAAVRRKGMQPRSKSFDSKVDAERWARSLEAELDRCGALPDTRPAESTTLTQILTRYRDEVSPKKRSAITEVARINTILRRPICHRTLALLSSSDLATYRDDRLKLVAPATVIRDLSARPPAPRFRPHIPTRYRLPRPNPSACLQPICWLSYSGRRTGMRINAAQHRVACRTMAPRITTRAVRQSPANKLAGVIAARQP